MLAYSLLRLFVSFASFSAESASADDIPSSTASYHHLCASFVDFPFCLSFSETDNSSKTCFDSDSSTPSTISCRICSCCWSSLDLPIAFVPTRVHHCRCYSTSPCSIRRFAFATKPFALSPTLFLVRHRSCRWNALSFPLGSSRLRSERGAFHLSETSSLGDGQVFSSFSLFGNLV